jgi:hypothetical protein
MKTSLAFAAPALVALALASTTGTAPASTFAASRRTSRVRRPRAAEAHSSALVVRLQPSPNDTREPR